MGTSEVSAPLQTDTFVPTRSTALLWVALVAATAISSIPILHAIAVGTGQLSISAPLPPLLSVISEVVHGLACLIFAAAASTRTSSVASLDELFDDSRRGVDANHPEVVITDGDIPVNRLS